MPAVLVECGFASNRVEGRELSSPEYQQAISDGIAQGIARFVRAGGHAGNL
jgi:N-acetylmuramoyl-L-alanine amidase